ncbi:MAG: hypothetical protein ACK5HO_02170 [Pseudomonadota bacterium]|jgi:hypothetical protein
MSHGGKRSGAGRPKGAVAKLTASAVARAKLTGELPHEFLLRVVRGESIDDQVPTLEQRIAAAVSVAPYFAPKLAAIEQRVETNVRAVVSSKPLSKEEFIKQYCIDYAPSNSLAQLA